MTETQLIPMLTNGGFAALAMFMVIYVMRENSRREDRAQALLEKYAIRFEDMTSRLGEMAQTLETIERRIPEGMGRVK